MGQKLLRGNPFSQKAEWCFGNAPPPFPSATPNLELAPPHSYHQKAVPLTTGSPRKRSKAHLRFQILLCGFEKNHITSLSLRSLSLTRGRRVTPVHSGHTDCDTRPYPHRQTVGWEDQALVKLLQISHCKAKYLP